MPQKKTQYVLVPANGLVASAENPKLVQFFESLHASAEAPRQLHQMKTVTGASLSMKVVDSIGENKAKLIECDPKDLPALRAAHPSVRVLPVVYFKPAVMKHLVERRPVIAAVARKTRAKSKPTAITITIVSSQDNKPVPNAMVVAFTDFASRAGAQGKTNSRGQVSLALGASSKKIQRLYVYPETGYWPALQENITIKNGSTQQILSIDLTYIDCVRYFYPGTDLSLGRGVTVGVIDSGIALNHPGLTVEGGQNTVPGENPNDYGDNGTEGHGTHVAGIIAARGTPPSGVRGVAPGVTLRSYRVFGKGANQSSNYAIAKAIDAAVADKCDLLNMSLGGGDPDTLTAEALTSAHDAGVVVFAATGNDSRQPVSFPAANSMCQAVSAMGRLGTFPKGTEPNGSIAAPYGKDGKNFVADFSNIGPETDLTGPGVGVISTVPNGFGVMSGTSMATPAETGAVARVLAAKPQILAMARDQNRSSAMISAIAAAAKSLGFGPTYEGKGMI